MEAGTMDPPVAAAPPVEPKDAGPQPPEQDETANPPSELVIDGEGQLSFGVGGKRPTSGTLRLTGGKIEVDGQYEKGSKVAVRIEAIVDAVEFKDETDGKTGQVVGCQRRHKARIVGVHVLSE